MGKLLIISLLLLAAIWVGWEIHQDPGYVLIRFRHWKIETSLWMGILLLLVFFVLLYAVLRLIARTSAWPRRWRVRRQARREESARQLALVAYCEMIEEKWAAAEHNFHKAATGIQHPFIEYCGAAIAAESQGFSQRREEYLRSAYLAAPQTEITLAILRAKLQIQARQWSEASATIQKLKAALPQHPIIKNLADQLPT